MKNLREVSTEDRMRIREILQSDNWALLEQVAHCLIAAGLEICGNAKEDHRYHQGCVAGLRDYLQTLEVLAKTVDSQTPKEAADVVSYRPHRTASTGIY